MRRLPLVLVLLTLKAVLIGCGAPSVYSLRALEADSTHPKYAADIVLYLSGEFRDYVFYQYEYESRLGEILTPSVKAVAAQAFAGVQIVEDNAELEKHVGKRTILIPKIASAFRDETGAFSTWSDCHTKVELKWELRGTDKSVVWEAILEGNATKNHGNVFTRKKNIQQSLKMASEEAIQNSYTAIMSSSAIREYVSSLE